jgi:hypothetical protein
MNTPTSPATTTGQQPSPSFVTTNPSINRKVAFASVGAALGSVIIGYQTKPGAGDGMREE